MRSTYVLATLRFQGEPIGHFTQIDRGEVHAADIDLKARRIGESHRFDGVFGAVQERTEYLGIVILARKAVEPRHVVGIGLAKLWNEACPLTGSNHAKSQRTRPFIQLDSQRRLIAIRQAVDDVRLISELSQCCPNDHVRFNSDHHHVLVSRDCIEPVSGAHFGVSGRLDHHIDAALDQGGRVIGHCKRAPPNRLIDRRRCVAAVDRITRNTSQSQRRRGSIDDQVGGDGDSHPSHPTDASDDLRPKCPGANDADVDRAIFLRQLV